MLITFRKRNTNVNYDQKDLRHTGLLASPLGLPSTPVGSYRAEAYSLKSMHSRTEEKRYNVPANMAQNGTLYCPISLLQPLLFSKQLIKLAD